LRLCRDRAQPSRLEHKSKFCSMLRLNGCAISIWHSFENGTHHPSA
jgi:hypothetical protein